MARKRSKIPRSADSNESKKPEKPNQHPDESVRWWREAIESVVVAIILAFLFRSFEAEAFVIPTGSMAPTLQGRHKDVNCPSCGYLYKSGASLDSERQPSPGRQGRGIVESTTCPICNFHNQLSEQDYDPNYATFTGDRILVNKFAFEWKDPEPWDVVVFKYPGNAKQNYIKRCIATPGCTVAIQYGDVFLKKPGNDDFEISRKPKAKLPYLLQTVHDTRHTSEVLESAGFPNCWQSAESTWDSADTGFTLSRDENESWLRYRHIRASFNAWDAILHDEQPTANELRPSLISDFYAYNATGHEYGGFYEVPLGQNWVGDLALEANLRVTSESGEILLDLVEGGRHFRCTIDVASGVATLKMPEGETFTDGDGSATSAETSTKTKIKGPGNYRVMFANVDDELVLFVNGWASTFDASTTFVSPQPLRPVWSPKDPGDLAPLGIGGRDIEMKVKRLRVLRDVYYVADGWNDFPCPTQRLSDREIAAGPPYQLKRKPPRENPRVVFTTPEGWAKSGYFSAYPRFERKLEKFPDNPARDQFFVLGDNSPQSKDSRLWPEQPRDEFFVERELLIGKAVFIYWPHMWRVNIPGIDWGLPILPNFWRMGRIH